MAIDQVNFTKALNNEAYAAQVIRSGKCSASQRGQLAAQWGTDKIAKWESVDSTQYEITDIEKSTAKNTGAKRAEDGAKTDKDGNVNNEGFDGKSDGAKSALGAGISVASGVSGAGAAAIVAFASKIMNLADKKAVAAKRSSFIAAAVGAVLVALSSVLRSMDPNSEQAQACDNLKSDFDEAEQELGDIQSEVSDKANEITEQTDELMKKTEEKEEAEETYITKKENIESSGEPLTEQQKAGLKSNFAEVKSLADESSQLNDELSDNIEQSEELFDSEGEKIEEIQGLTDYQAEFDEATVDNAKLVRTASYVGEVGAAGVAVGGLLGLAKWGNWAAMAAGAVALGEAAVTATNFSKVIENQNKYINSAEAGVNNRTHLEDVNKGAGEQYEQDLDTYAADIEFQEETAPGIELKSEAPVSSENETPNEDNSDETSNPFTPSSTGSAADVSGKDNDLNPFDGKKDKDDDK